MRLSAPHGPVPTDDFLVNLLGTQIPLRTIVCRRDIITMEEKKYGIRVLAQTPLERMFFLVLLGTIVREEEIPLMLQSDDRA